MGTGLCQEQASVPRFLETRKLGLAGSPFLQVNQLDSGVGEILVFIPQPPYSQPTLTTHHTLLPQAESTCLRLCLGSGASLPPL